MQIVSLRGGTLMYESHKKKFESSYSQSLSIRRNRFFRQFLLIGMVLRYCYGTTFVTPIPQTIFTQFWLHSLSEHCRAFRSSACNILSHPRRAFSLLQVQIVPLLLCIIQKILSQIIYLLYIHNYFKNNVDFFWPFTMLSCQNPFDSCSLNGCNRARLHLCTRHLRE